MKALLLIALSAVLLAAAPAYADPGPAGTYRLTGEHDVASELILSPDGHFTYFLAAGALDEQAKGRWVRDGANLRLTTEPEPVPAIFSAGPATQDPGVRLSILVRWPTGQGVAGVDLTIGFAEGDPVSDYTQDYGWTLPVSEKRAPLWVELVEPIHGIVGPRFAIDASKGNALTFILTPNDIGTVAFHAALVEVRKDMLMLHWREGVLTYVREAQ